MPTVHCLLSTSEPPLTSNLLPGGASPTWSLAEKPPSCSGPTPVPPKPLLTPNAALVAPSATRESSEQPQLSHARRRQEHLASRKHFICLLVWETDKTILQRVRAGVNKAKLRALRADGLGVQKALPPCAVTPTGCSVGGPHNPHLLATRKYPSLGGELVATSPHVPRTKHIHTWCFFHVDNNGRGRSPHAWPVPPFRPSHVTSCTSSSF